MGCILIQQFPGEKRICSFNSSIFDKIEQKMSTLHRELCGLVSALKTYELYIIGSIILFNFIVITNQSFSFWDAKDNYQIGFLDIK